ncbi:MAG: hypothetical protein HYW63_03505 [Candidatus Levybacteria bacterium]|nr:hypothetical protein [Candidatus Levybacteria bacterium]
MLFNFLEDTNKEKKKKEKKLPISAEITKDADRVTARELDEFFREGKGLDDEKEKTSA